MSVVYSEAEAEAEWLEIKSLGWHVHGRWGKKKDQF